MKDKYIIVCPKCESTFDCSKQMQIWKDEFIEDLTKLVENKFKNEKSAKSV